MLTKGLNGVLLLLLIVCSSSLVAQPEKYVAGTHYLILDNPVRTGDPSKIEVVEAFWYGCPHCFSFEPLIVDWEKSLPSDVEFGRFPAMFNSLMKVHAQIYFTAQNMDVLNLIHNAAYEALVLERKKLQTEKQIGDLFLSVGIAREDFSKSFNSFSVKTKLKQAELRMKEYNIRGTPAMLVNGKYGVMTGDSVRTQQEMLKVVDFLVNKERILH